MWLLHTFKLKLLALMAVLAILAGCKEALYSELTEADANEMVALLVLSGVPASREKAPSGTFTVMVEEADLPVAVTVLKNAGLPREQFASLGDIFGDVGVVGTPFEERIRYAFATNQELSRTITEIKGIENTRVHVVIPPEVRFGQSEQIARASIAVFHDSSFAPSEYSSRIKALAAYAVPGLEIENISLTFFPTTGFVVETSGLTVPAVSGAAMANTQNDGALRGASWEAYIFGLIIFMILILFVRLTILGLRNMARPFGVGRRS